MSEPAKELKTTQHCSRLPVGKLLREKWQTEKRREKMSNSFMCVDEVATELGVSKSYAYKVVQKLNKQLKYL